MAKSAHCSLYCLSITVLFVQVWDTRNARIADYVNMNVQSGIAGRSSYSVGDVFCLNSPFTERGMYVFTFIPHLQFYAIIQ